MISTISQYLLVSLCAFFLACSFAQAGEGHGDLQSTGRASQREITSTKEVPTEEVTSVSTEDARKLLNSYEEVQSKLNPTKSGEVEE